jgi:signal transduction histidine kinase
MSVIKQFISRIPYWAFLLLVLVIIVNTIYLLNRYNQEFDNTGYKIENGRCVITSIAPGGSAEKAGMQIDDIVKSINSLDINELSNIDYLYDLSKYRDTLTYKILRNDGEVNISLVQSSIMSESSQFFYTMYVLILIVSCSSVYILYKKPGDKSARIFFIYFQLYAIVQNVSYLQYPDLFANFASFIFMFSVSFSGITLIHFHLLFPQQALIYKRLKRLPLIFYTIGSLGFILISVYYFKMIFRPSPEFYSSFEYINEYFLLWVTLTFIIALAVVFYQLKTIKSTLARNQIRIVIIGSFFGFAPLMFYAVFNDFFNQRLGNYIFIFLYLQWIGNLIMSICLLLAIFRFRIWDTEIFIRKALLYVGASIVIMLSYFLMIYLAQQITSNETNLTRFLSMTVSVIIFLVLRDMLQRLIDRFFHREAYDSATVVGDFEEKLTGIYRFEELKSGIVQGLDNIFHFKSLVFSLKKEELTYEQVYSFGQVQIHVEKEYKVTPEMEQKLQKSKVFSPAELDQKPSVPEMANSELVVPLLKENKPYGFFLCGPKKSEKTYSLQDIRVLSLIAKRVIALFNTAGLYQKDLDRQLILERERERISQDMHDDIGAGLTRIAMISETGFKTSEQNLEVRERMAKVASSSRDMIARLNVIVWALNPRYDNLDSLISYSRRYFGEYLDNFGIHFMINVPDIIPQLSITPDFRRNVFYTLQEAIHNAVKHGDPSEIKFQALIYGNKIEITVTDNGRGFETVIGNNHGNGLLNMKKRADDICGSFDIQSLPGHGTVVRLIFNLNENTTKG